MVMGGTQVDVEGSRATVSSSSPADPTRPNRQGTIPQRLNYLFDQVRAPDGDEFSTREVAKRIADSGFGKISYPYIGKIRSGERSNPGVDYVRPLAKFFMLELMWFYDPDPDPVDGELLSTMIMMRDTNMKSLIERISRLSEPQQKALGDIIDSLLRAEGKDPYDH